MMALPHPVAVLEKIATRLLSPPGLLEFFQISVAVCASVHEQLWRNHFVLTKSFPKKRNSLFFWPHRFKHTSEKVVIPHGKKKTEARLLLLCQNVISCNSSSAVKRALNTTGSIVTAADRRDSYNCTVCLTMSALPGAVSLRAQCQIQYRCFLFCYSASNPLTQTHSPSSCPF